jgi:hypothetical protein
MTNNGQHKTVGELCEALERLAEERDRYLATIDEAEFGIKECARVTMQDHQRWQTTVRQLVSVS